MENIHWFRQSPDNPLFPDLLWSRPENKSRAGKLLIIGGNSFGFSAVGSAYAEAMKAGAGSCRVLLPAAVKKVVGTVLEHAEFAPSNPSGSFAQEALSDWLEQAEWADAVLLAGDMGHNSETAIVLEKFLTKYTGQVTLTGDTLDLALTTPDVVYARPDTLAVASMGQLQKLGTAARFTTSFRLGMDLLQLVDALHQFTLKQPLHIITKHHEQLVVAARGHVSTTSLKPDLDIWRVKTATQAAVWWLQNPDKPFEALSTSVIDNQ